VTTSHLVRQEGLAAEVKRQLKASIANKGGDLTLVELEQKTVKDTAVPNHVSCVITKEKMEMVINGKFIEKTKNVTLLRGELLSGDGIEPPTFR
jgi:hypothetical protein